jgi:HK97 family phage major capsid protein
VTTIHEVRERCELLGATLADLDSSVPARPDERRKVAGELDSARGQLEDLEYRYARLCELAQDPNHREPVDSHSRKKTRMRTDTSPGAEVRAAAHKAVDRAYEAGQLSEPAGFNLVDLIDRDRFGLDSAYIEAVAAPAYERAFAKKLTGMGGAEATLEPDESAAMLAVGRAMAQRAMAVGEGKTGGFGVPLTLDPTILLTNDGAINPIRDLATVSTIATTTWQGVSSKGVEAKFAGEAVAPTDGSPELGQPEIKPEKAQIWVPYSIEVGMDWSGLAAELAKLFADAKAVKEAEVFATGKGSENIPQGLITGATKVVEGGTKEIVKIADVYAVQEALAARWHPRASWLGSNTVANTVHKMVAVGDTTNAAIMADDRSSILGKPFHEVSTMSSKVTTKKERVLAYGDIASAYRVVDRIGLSVEPVPLVTKEGVPTGQRGLYAWFRVGAKVIVPEAVQVLAVKNE